MTTAQSARLLRTRAATRAALASVLVRIASLATTIAATWVAARVLSASDLSVWFVLLSLTTFQGLVDLGLLSHFTTAVAEVQDPHGSGSRQVAALYRGTIRTTSRLAAAAAASATVLAVAWFRNKNIDLAAILVFIAVLASSIPAQAPLRLLHALQRGATANLLIAVGNVVALLGVATFYLLPGQYFAVFTTVSVVGPLVAGLLAWIMTRSIVGLEAQPHELLAPRVTKTLKESWPYIAISASTLVAFSSDTILLAWLADDAAVAEYSTSYRVFTMIPITVFLAAQSLWPAAANARTGGDAVWLKTTTRRVLAASFAVTSVCASILLAFGGPLIAWWTGDVVRPRLLVLATCALYAVVNAVWSPLHFLLLGEGRVRFQAFCVMVMAPLNLAVSALLIPRYGAAGPVIGSTFSLSIAVVVPYVWVSRRTLFSNSYKPNAKRASAKSLGSTP